MLQLLFSLILSTAQYQVVTNVTDTMVESIDTEGYKHRVNREDIHEAYELHVGSEMLGMYVPNVMSWDDDYLGSWVIK